MKFGSLSERRKADECFDELLLREERGGFEDERLDFGVESLAFSFKSVREFEVEWEPASNSEV